MSNKPNNGNYNSFKKDGLAKNIFFQTIKVILKIQIMLYGMKLKKKYYLLNPNGLVIHPTQQT